MDQNELEIREEELQMLANKIQDSGLSFPDIRDREWLNSDSKASKVLNLLIQAENLLIELDELQMENGQNYPEIEDMMLEIGELRSSFTNYVDNNLDLLKIK